MLTIMPAPTTARATDATHVAAALRVSVGLLRRRLRQVPVQGGLTLPETSALARLEQAGATTGGALAREEQISPQSMGATLAALEAKGLVHRAADPDDGRRAVISLTEAGTEAVRSRRDAKLQQLATAMADEFSDEELRQLAQAAPLIERLARAL
jgi:DNA-binding MarR family transcriptional regulator